MGLVAAHPLDAFSLRLRWVNEWQRPADWNMSRVMPGSFYWYIVSGELEIRIDHTAYRLRAGDLLFVPLLAEIEARTLCGRPVHYLALGCEAEWTSTSELSFVPEISVIRSVPAEESDRLAAVWRTLIGCARENEGTERRPDAYFYLQALWYQWIAALIPILPLQLRPVGDERVERLCLYIRAHPQERLPLERLARMAHVSPNHLRVLFQKELQTTPADYAREVRLKLAQELLLTSNHPVGEIAAQVGYPDQSKFSRAFKQRFGLSPQPYRTRWKRTFQDAAIT